MTVHANASPIWNDPNSVVPPEFSIAVMPLCLALQIVKIRSTQRRAEVTAMTGTSRPRRSHGDRHSSVSLIVIRVAFWGRLASCVVLSICPCVPDVPWPVSTFTGSPVALTDSLADSSEMPACAVSHPVPFDEYVTSLVVTSCWP